MARIRNRLIFLPLLAAVVSCASGPTGGYLAGDVSDDFSGIETSLTVEPAEIAAGAGATLEIAIANTTERDVEIRFPETRQIVLLVRDADGDLAYTDDHTVAVPTYLSLGTLESWSHAIDWDGRVDVDGRRLALPPGRYELRGALRRAGSLYVNRTPPVTIEILPSAD